MEAMILLIQRLFPTVLRMSLSASILVFVVIVLRLLLRNAPKWLHCLLWAVVAIRLLFPVLPETQVSMMPSSDAVIVSEERLSRAMDTGLPTFAFETPRDHAINNAYKESGQNVMVSTEAAPSQYLPLLWLAGVAAMQLYALISYLRLKRRVSVSVPYKGNCVLCDGAESPFILGVFHPHVYLPSGLTEPQLSYVQAHENAHLKRHDHWWKPFGFLLLSVHWFNPVLWLAYVLLCRDIELACDEKVIRELGRDERADYSQALLDGSRIRHRISACPVAFGETDVKIRVKAVLNYKKPTFWIILTAVLACIVLVVCFTTDPPAKEPGAVESSMPAVSGTGDPPAGGAEVFRRYYQKMAEDSGGVGVSHMDLDVLDAMASSTVGTAVDTEELRIEVAGAIFSGNTAEIVLRVTAKQLESVLREGNSLPSPHYRFGDETALLSMFTLNRRFWYLSHHYYYSDTNDALAPNQFELRYWIITPEPFHLKSYTIPYWVDVPESSDEKPLIIPLSNFGYYEQGRFVPLYEGDSENEGDWNVEIALDPASDIEKNVSVHREITVGDYRFSVKEIQLTPLACTVRLDCLEDETVIEEQPDKILEAFSDTFIQGTGNVSLIASDGAGLSSDYCYGGGSGREYYVILPLLAPVSVDRVTALSLPGQEIPLR